MSNNYSSRNPVWKGLEQDPNVVAIHFSSYTAPFVRSDLWGEQERAKLHISGLSDYLEKPYIEDVFGNDHKARGEWITTLDSEVFSLLKPSPIGGGRVNGIRSRLNVLNDLDYVGTDPQRLTDLITATLGYHHKKLFSDTDQPYDLWTVAEKEALMDGLRNRVHGVLAFLSEQRLIS